VYKDYANFAKLKKTKMKLQIIEDTSVNLLLGIERLIERTARNVALYLNTENKKN
jgi:hypothetical protein